MSPAPKNKSVLVACSLEQYARHTQTVNLYAPLTLRFGQTHMVYHVLRRGVVRRAARRSEMQIMFAVRELAKDLGRSHDHELMTPLSARP